MTPRSWAYWIGSALANARELGGPLRTPDGMILDHDPAHAARRVYEGRNADPARDVVFVGPWPVWGGPLADADAARDAHIEGDEYCRTEDGTIMRTRDL